MDHLDLPDPSKLSVDFARSKGFCEVESAMCDLVLFFHLEDLAVRVYTQIVGCLVCTASQPPFKERVLHGIFDNEAGTELVLIEEPHHVEKRLQCIGNPRDIGRMAV